MEKIRTATVSSIWRQSQARFPQGRDKIVPSLRLSGLWFENLGFEIGQKVEIYSTAKGQLLLNVVPPGNRSDRRRRSKNSKQRLRGAND